MRVTQFCAAFLVAAALCQPALAQDAPGKVTYLKTAPGTVLVQRGGEVFQLSEGDVVLPGDLVFTRTNGALRIDINDCSISMGGQSTLEITPDVCQTAPVLRAPEFQVAGVTLGIGQTGGIGATPTILGALLVAGGAAAAAGGGGSPASP